MSKAGVRPGAVKSEGDRGSKNNRRQHAGGRTSRTAAACTDATGWASRPAGGATWEDEIRDTLFDLAMTYGDEAMHTVGRALDLMAAELGREVWRDEAEMIVGAVIRYYAAPDAPSMKLH